MSIRVKRRAGRTRVSSKNQVTLPVAVLQEAHLGPGDELAVNVDDNGRVVLTRVGDPLEDLIGAAPGLSELTDLAALRDEWAR
jgi:AbrB family looped-hinge helix DNA binding protein